MTSEDRPPIPAELRRRVLVEAGHRCAIPTCRHIEVDVHHIIPWETCKKHEYENLIALCPNCHRRADRGEIDRKSLRMYKANVRGIASEQRQQEDSPDNWIKDGSGVELCRLPQMVEDELSPSAQQGDEIPERVKSPESAWEENYLALDGDVNHKRQAQARSDSVEGVQQVYEAAHSIIAEAKTRVDQLNEASKSLKMGFVRDPSKTLPDSLLILGPWLPYSELTTKPPRLSLRFSFEHHYNNSLEGTCLFIDIIRLGSDRNDPSEGTLEEFELVPKFDRVFNVYWEGKDRIFRDGTAVLHFAFDRFAQILSDEADKAGSFRY